MFERKKNEDFMQTTEQKLRSPVKQELVDFLKMGVGEVGGRKGILNGILFSELYQLANISYKRKKERGKEFCALK